MKRNRVEYQWFKAPHGLLAFMWETGRCNTETNGVLDKIRFEGLAKFAKIEAFDLQTGKESPLQFNPEKPHLELENVPAEVPVTLPTANGELYKTQIWGEVWARKTYKYQTNQNGARLIRARSATTRSQCTSTHFCLRLFKVGNNLGAEA